MRVEVLVVTNKIRACSFAKEFLIRLTPRGREGGANALIIIQFIDPSRPRTSPLLYHEMDVSIRKSVMQLRNVFTRRAWNA